MTARQIASDAIALFVESLDHLEITHGLNDDDIERASATALGEVSGMEIADHAEIARLTAVNERLLATMQKIAQHNPDTCGGITPQEYASAAIAAAKEPTP